MYKKSTLKVDFLCLVRKTIIILMVLLNLIPIFLLIKNEFIF